MVPARFAGVSAAGITPLACPYCPPDRIRDAPKPQNVDVDNFITIVLKVGGVNINGIEEISNTEESSEVL
jgi:hypothetical protein